ncbi:MAG: acetyl-CoA carboxylase biotin carboxyl carrier protein [Acetobacteraceae bacterium]|nr:acetyl-CoA carboxylase biotin carboxyl carrier protein [Acetobacteraceae bacterium]
MSGVRFDPEAIRTLAAILAETGLTEIEIAEKDSRIRVARSPAPVAVTAGVQPVASAPSPPAEVGMTAPSGGSSLAEEDFAEHPGAVLSPMVGIVYLSPEPGSPPFVAVGQTVTTGQTLLLIEAMKTFNQIKAPKSGTVARILVASGTPVEYGEPLVLLE